MHLLSLLQKTCRSILTAERTLSVPFTAKEALSMKLVIASNLFKVLSWIDSGEHPFSSEEQDLQVLMDMDLIARGSANVTGLGFHILEDFYRRAFSENEHGLVFNV